MQIIQEVGGVGKFSVGKNDRMPSPRILLYKRSPYLMGIITYNGLTGIVTVKTAVCRSFEHTGDNNWPRCVFPCTFPELSASCDSARMKAICAAPNEPADFSAQAPY